MLARAQGWPTIHIIDGIHHRTLKDLEDASTMHCGICSTLFEQWNSIDRTEFMPGSPFTTYEYDDTPASSLDRAEGAILRLRFEFSEDRREFMLLEQDDLPQNDLGQDSCLGFQSENDPSVHRGESGAIPLASSWLQTCLRGHLACSRSSPSQPLSNSQKAGITHTQSTPSSEESHAHRCQSADFFACPAKFPKRLLEIRTSQVRLTETSNEVPDRPYATLSHCWGSHPTFQILTAENLSKLKTEVHLESLPRTFRDAIEVCRGLEIKYLWIDSLCIIQRGKGSIEDWQVHIRSMREIYASGLVNISADRASCAEDGFLHPRDPESIRPITIFEANPSQSTLSVIDLELARSSLMESPIAKRGWVLQERLLSPRVLHFTPRQLFWECCELPLACEMYPSGVPRLADQQNLNFAPFDITSLSSDSHMEWYRIIEDYTNRKLTYPDKDKFAALVGVAQKVRKKKNDRYIAGLFQSHLPDALLWCIHPRFARETDGSPQTNPYRAPSWSWASLDSPVSFFLPKYLEQYLLVEGRRSQSIAYTADVVEVIPSGLEEGLPQDLAHPSILRLCAHAAKVRWSNCSKDHYLKAGLQFEFVDIDCGKDEETIGTVDRLDYLFGGLEDAVAVLLVDSTRTFPWLAAGLFLISDMEDSCPTYRRIGCWYTLHKRAGIPHAMRKTEPRVVTIL
jgi:Heterokaryon incompatibility protein (HET)